MSDHKPAAVGERNLLADPTEAGIPLGRFPDRSHGQSIRVGREGHKIEVQIDDDG
jgi:hypothetical protein